MLTEGIVWAMTLGPKCSLCVEVVSGRVRKSFGGKAEERRGDVAALMVTTLPPNDFHAKEIPTKLRLC